MKQYILPSLLALATCFSSCNDKAEGESKNASNTNLPMPVAYSGKAEIGSHDNTVNVMKWNKWLSNGQMDSAFSLLADSVTVRLSSGEVFNTTADSLKPVIRGYFNAMSSVNIQYVAVLPVNVKVSENLTDEWVLSWTDETYMMRDGKKDHNIIHEDYRLVNGKIREINQYSRKVAEMAAADTTKKK